MYIHLCFCCLFLHSPFCRTIDRRKRLLIIMDAAFGMEYLHGKNIIHFDFKCENLLVNMKDPQRPICKVIPYIFLLFLKNEVNTRLLIIFGNFLYLCKTQLVHLLMQQKPVLLYDPVCLDFTSNLHTKRAINFNLLF